jgi:hypothetical protein
MTPDIAEKMKITDPWRIHQNRRVAQIEAIGPLPRNVEWLHHGAVSGIDSFREVSRIVVGRQAPSPSAVQACAEALTGAACTRLPARQWYQRIDAVHELTVGWSLLSATVIPTASPRRSGAGSPCSSYSRSSAAAVELQQIIGRGRGLWRTADNPLHVLVLTDVALDMPVEELVPVPCASVRCECCCKREQPVCHQSPAPSTIASGSASSDDFIVHSTGRHVV